MFRQAIWEKAVENKKNAFNNDNDLEAAIGLENNLKDGKVIISVEEMKAAAREVYRGFASDVLKAKLSEAVEKDAQRRVAAEAKEHQVRIDKEIDSFLNPQIEQAAKEASRNNEVQANKAAVVERLVEQEKEAHRKAGTLESWDEALARDWHTKQFESQFRNQKSGEVERLVEQEKEAHRKAGTLESWDEALARDWHSKLMDTGREAEKLTAKLMLEGIAKEAQRVAEEELRSTRENLREQYAEQYPYDEEGLALGWHREQAKRDFERSLEYKEEVDNAIASILFGHNLEKAMELTLLEHNLAGAITHMIKNDDFSVQNVFNRVNLLSFSMGKIMPFVPAERMEAYKYMSAKDNMDRNLKRDALKQATKAQAVMEEANRTNQIYQAIQSKLRAENRSVVTLEDVRDALKSNLGGEAAGEIDLAVKRKIEELDEKINAIKDFDTLEGQKNLWEILKSEGLEASWEQIDRLVRQEKESAKEGWDESLAREWHTKSILKDKIAELKEKKTAEAKLKAGKEVYEKAKLEAQNLFGRDFNTLADFMHARYLMSEEFGGLGKEIYQRAQEITGRQKAVGYFGEGKPEDVLAQAAREVIEERLIDQETDRRLAEQLAGREQKIDALVERERNIMEKSRQLDRWDEGLARERYARSHEENDPLPSREEIRGQVKAEKEASPDLYTDSKDFLGRDLNNILVSIGQAAKQPLFKKDAFMTKEVETKAKDSKVQELTIFSDHASYKKAGELAEGLPAKEKALMGELFKGSLDANTIAKMRTGTINEKSLYELARSTHYKTQLAQLSISDLFAMQQNVEAKLRHETANRSDTAVANETAEIHMFGFGKVVLLDLKAEIDSMISDLLLQKLGNSENRQSFSRVLEAQRENNRLKTETDTVQFVEIVNGQRVAHDFLLTEGVRNKAIEATTNFVGALMWKTLDEDQNKLEQLISYLKASLKNGSTSISIKEAFDKAELGIPEGFRDSPFLQLPVMENMLDMLVPQVEGLGANRELVKLAGGKFEVIFGDITGEQAKEIKGITEAIGELSEISAGHNRLIAEVLSRIEEKSVEEKGELRKKIEDVIIEKDPANLAKALDTLEKMYGEKLKEMGYSDTDIAGLKNDLRTKVEKLAKSLIECKDNLEKAIGKEFSSLKSLERFLQIFNMGREWAKDIETGKGKDVKEGSIKAIKAEIGKIHLSYLKGDYSSRGERDIKLAPLKEKLFNQLRASNKEKIDELRGILKDIKLTDNAVAAPTAVFNKEAGEVTLKLGDEFVDIILPELRSKDDSNNDLTGVQKIRDLTLSRLVEANKDFQSKYGLAKIIEKTIEESMAGKEFESQDKQEAYRVEQVILAVREVGKAIMQEFNAYKVRNILESKEISNKEKALEISDLLNSPVTGDQIKNITEIDSFINSKKDAFKDMKLIQREFINILTGKELIEAAMGNGKTLAAGLALIADRLIRKEDASGISLYMNPSSILVAKTIKDLQFWGKLFGHKVENFNAYVENLPTTLLYAMLKRTDSIFVGSMDTAPQIFNKRISMDIFEREAVEGIFEYLREKNSFVVWDEAQNLILSQIEAIVGEGHASLEKYRSRGIMLYNAIKKLDQTRDFKKLEITLSSAEYASYWDKTASSSLLNSFKGSDQQAWTMVRDRFIASRGLENAIRRELGNDKNIGAGEIASAFSAYMEKGKRVAFTKEGRVVPAESGMNANQILQDPMYTVVSALRRAEISGNNVRINWRDSSTGGTTTVASNALWFLREVSGRHTALSGTLSPYKHSLSLLFDGTVNTLGGKPALNYKVTDAQGNPVAPYLEFLVRGSIEHKVEIARGSYKELAAKVKEVLNKDGAFISVRQTELAELKNALKEAGLLDKADIYDNAIGNDRKIELGNALERMGKGQIIVAVLEIAKEGLNVAEGVQLFHAADKGDISGALQLFARINRTNSKSNLDNINLFFTREGVNKYLQDNHLVSTVLKERWEARKKEISEGQGLPEAKQAEIATLDNLISNLDNLKKSDSIIADEMAVLLAFHIGEEVLKSQVAQEQFNRVVQDLGIKMPFEMLKALWTERVFTSKGTPQEKIYEARLDFLSQVEQEFILKHNSELYASYAFKDKADPMDIAKNILTSMSRQIATLTDVLSGVSSRFASKDYEYTNAVYYQLTQHKAAKEILLDKQARKEIDDIFSLKEWDFESSLQTKWEKKMQSRIGGEGNNRQTAPPVDATYAQMADNLKEDINTKVSKTAGDKTHVVDNLLDWSVYLADNVFLPSVRTSSNSSKEIVAEKAQVLRTVNAYEALLQKKLGDTLKFNQETKDKLSLALDGLGKNSFSPYFAGVLAGELSQIASSEGYNGTAGGAFLATLANSILNIANNASYVINGSNTQDINLLQTAINVNNAINNSVGAYPGLSVSDQKLFKDLLSLAINPVVEKEGDSEGLYGYNRLEKLVGRAHYIEAVAGKGAAARTPYFVQTQDAMVNYWLGLNKTNSIGSWLRRGFAQKDRGSDNVKWEAMIRPFEYSGKTSLWKMSRVLNANPLYSSVSPLFTDLKLTEKQKNLMLAGGAAAAYTLAWASFSLLTMGAGLVAGAGIALALRENRKDFIKLDDKLNAISGQDKLLKNYMLAQHKAAQDTAKGYLLQQKDYPKLMKALGFIRPFSPFSYFYIKNSPSDRNLFNMSFNKYFKSSYGIKDAGDQDLSLIEQLNKTYSMFAAEGKNRATRRLLGFIPVREGRLNLGMLTKFNESSLEARLKQVDEILGTTFSDDYKGIEELKNKGLDTDAPIEVLQKILGKLGAKAKANNGREIDMFDIAASGMKADKTKRAEYQKLINSLYDISTEIVNKDTMSEAEYNKKMQGFKDTLDSVITHLQGLSTANIASRTEEKASSITNARINKRLGELLNNDASFINNDIEARGINNLKGLIKNELEKVDINKELSREAVETDDKLGARILDQRNHIIAGIISAIAYAESHLEKNIGDEYNEVLFTKYVRGILKDGSLGLKDKVERLHKLAETGAGEYKHYIRAQEELRKILGSDRETFIYQTQETAQRKKADRQFNKKLLELIGGMERLLLLKYEAQDMVGDHTLPEHTKYFYQIALEMMNDFSAKNAGALAKLKSNPSIAAIAGFPEISLPHLHKLAGLKELISLYKKELALSDDVVAYDKDGYKGLLKSLGIELNSAKIRQEVVAVTGAAGFANIEKNIKDYILDRVVTAIALKAKGYLRPGMDLTDIVPLMGFTGKALKAQMRNDLQTPLQQLAQQLVYQVAKNDAEMSLAIKKDYEEAMAELNNWLAEKSEDSGEANIDIYFAPSYIDTVKFMDMRNKNQGLQVWIPLDRFEVYLGDNGKIGFKLNDTGVVEARHEILGHGFGLALGIPLGETREDIRGYNDTEVFAQLLTAIDTIFRAAQRGYINPSEFTYLKIDKTIDHIFSKKQRFSYWYQNKGNASKEMDVYSNFMRDAYAAYYFGQLQNNLFGNNPSIIHNPANVLRAFTEQAFRLFKVNRFTGSLKAFNEKESIQGIIEMLEKEIADTETSQEDAQELYKEIQVFRAQLSRYKYVPSKEYLEGKMLPNFSKWANDIRKTLAQGRGTTSIANEWLDLKGPTIAKLYPQSYFEMFYSPAALSLIKTTDSLPVLLAGGNPPPDPMIRRYNEMLGQIFEVDKTNKVYTIIAPKVGVTMDEDDFMDILMNIFGITPKQARSIWLYSIEYSPGDVLKGIDQQRYSRVLAYLGKSGAIELQDFVNYVGGYSAETRRFIAVFKAQHIYGLGPGQFIARDDHTKGDIKKALAFYSHDAAEALIRAEAANVDQQAFGGAFIRNTKTENKEFNNLSNHIRKDYDSIYSYILSIRYSGHSWADKQQMLKGIYARLFGPDYDHKDVNLNIRVGALKTILKDAYAKSDEAVVDWDKVVTAAKEVEKSNFGRLVEMSGHIASFFAVPGASFDEFNTNTRLTKAAEVVLNDQKLRRVFQGLYDKAGFGLLSSSSSLNNSEVSRNDIIANALLAIFQSEAKAVNSPVNNDPYSDRGRLPIMPMAFPPVMLNGVGSVVITLGGLSIIPAIQTAASPVGASRFMFGGKEYLESRGIGSSTLFHAPPDDNTSSSLSGPDCVLDTRDKALGSLVGVVGSSVLRAARSAASLIERPIDAQSATSREGQGAEGAFSNIASRELGNAVNRANSEPVVLVGAAKTSGASSAISKPLENLANLLENLTK
ncbi:DEAD/DEAH box helicase, partial [bacterium]